MEVQSPGEPRRKYCANCGNEIEPGKGIELNYRYTVCSEECKKDFNKGRIL
jgi:ribosomal protein L24E